MCRLKSIFSLLFLLGFGHDWLQAQDTKIGGFANVNYAFTDKENNFFAVGQFDNFITSQITDEISFLSEVVFDYRNNNFGLGIERVILKYEFDTYLDVKMGKFHNPLGYWNNAYHHGILIQPTISRPIAVKYEDRGGMLSIHGVGAWVSGRSIGKYKIGYDLAVSNGMGKSNNLIIDDNHNKGFVWGLHTKPVDKLEIGISGYLDKMNKGQIAHSGDTLKQDMKVRQFVGHIVYMGKKFELISEYYLINAKTAETHHTNAYFAYLGYRVTEKLTPYVLYDYIQYQHDESFFVKDNRKKFTLGCRYAMSHLANVKIELSHQESEKTGKTTQAEFSFAIGF